MGINVILGMGNFSAICWIRGLSKEEEGLFFSCEKIKILAPATVIIIITAIKMSKIFQKLRFLGGLVGGMGCGVSWS